jgi:hypothetical protein
MKKGSKSLLVAGALLASALIAVVALQVHRLNSEQTNLTDQQTRDILNRELPIGTDKSRVKRFLDARAWRYSDRGSAVQAMIKDASHNFLVRTDIQIQFLFDSEGKLVFYEIEDFHTGP